MRPNKLLYVDAMRGWAILMVIASHQALPFKNLSAPVRLLASYGQTGVFLFFVASAFTLCNSALGRENEHHRTRSFFIRRFFRIAPLYYLGMAFYLGLRALVPDTAGMLGDQPAVNVAANIALVHGFLPGAFTGAVPGGWSIGTEWAFYLMFPLLFAGCWKLHSLFGWKILLVPTVIVALVSALILVDLGIANDLFWFWYDFVFNQLPIFMIGIILFFLVRDNLFQPVLGRDIPVFVIFTTIGLWVLKSHFFVLLPLISAISFVFLFNILRATSRSFGLIERIGRASYSMYIFHFVFAVFTTAAILKAFPVGAAWANSAFGAALVISTAATYLVARISEKFIEHRFIEFGRILTRSHSPPEAVSRG